MTNGHRSAALERMADKNPGKPVTHGPGKPNLHKNRIRLKREAPMQPQIPPDQKKTPMPQVPQEPEASLQNRHELFLLFQQAPVPMSCTLLSPIENPLKLSATPPGIISSATRRKTSKSFFMKKVFSGKTPKPRPVSSGR
jgi:hypothetical protein